MSFPAYVTEQKNTDHYVDTFATYTGNEATPRYPASNGSNYGSRPVLQRANMALRVSTFALALAATLSTIFAKSTDTLGWTLDYRSSSAYGFFMIVNAVVCVYAFVVSGIAIFMWINGSVLSTPAKLLLMFLVLDVIGVVFLLLAFASAMATEVIGRNGFYAKFNDGDTSATNNGGVCKYYGNFCTVIEVGLGFSGAGILSFTAGTAIDGYYLHLRGV